MKCYGMIKTDFKTMFWNIYMTEITIHTLQENFTLWTNVIIYLHSYALMKVVKILVICSFIAWMILEKLFRSLAVENWTVWYSWQKGEHFASLVGICHFHILNEHEIPNTLVPYLLKSVHTFFWDFVWNICMKEITMYTLQENFT